MTGKLLAAALLLFGGGVTLYIIYKVVIGLILPVVQKKPTNVSQHSSGKPKNNLQLQNQTATKQSMKKQK